MPEEVGCLCIVNIEPGANGMCDPPDGSRHAILTRQYEPPGIFLCNIYNNTETPHAGVTIFLYNINKRLQFCGRFFVQVAGANRRSFVQFATYTRYSGKKKSRR